jgi:hypothetical protein
VRRVPTGLPQTQGIDPPAFRPIENHPGDSAATSASRAALVDLDRALCQDRSHVVLAALPGPGKAFLLRALPQRLPDTLRVVHLSHASTAGEDGICARILGALGREPGLDPEAHLLDWLRDLANRGAALVLLIDDAGSLPAQTLRSLGRLAAASRSGLRLALVVAVESRSDDAAVAEVVAALGVGVEKVVLDTPPRQAETRVCARAAPDRTAPRSDVGGLRSEESFTAIRTPRPRGSGSRGRRWLLPAAATLGIALAPLGIHRVAVPNALRPVAPETARIVDQHEPIRAPLPVPSERALARPATKRAGPEGAAGSAGSAGSEDAAQPAVTTRPAPDTAPRPIPVSLNARPWARIEVDGRDVGVTPLADLPIAPGLHRFRAHFPDGRVIERAVRVDANRDHIRFPSGEPRPIEHE